MLDEPLSQLDDAGARALVATLADLADEGIAVVVAEHRFEHLRDCPAAASPSNAAGSLRAGAVTAS